MAVGAVGDVKAIALRSVLVDDGGLLASDYAFTVIFGGVIRIISVILRTALGPINGIVHMPIAIVCNV